jgi:hypothetical protein
LVELSKTIAELSNGLSGARQVNAQLMRELGTLRALLRQHESSTAQQDEFLAALLEEHEEALTEFERLRDEALTRAVRIERERDELRAEASQLRARLGTHRISTNPPPPLPGTRPPSFRSTPALRLDASELDTALHARSLTTPPEAVVLPPPTATEFPRESTRPGVGGPKPSEPPARPSFGPPPSGWKPPTPENTPTERPPRPVSAASLPADSVGALPILKRKPDASTRPLVDYSLGEGGVESETLEGARIPTKSSKPPKK